MSLNISLIGNAMVHIDEAISDLEDLHNRGIDDNATDKLRKIYDWLDTVIETFDAMEEIERIGKDKK